MSTGKSLSITGQVLVKGETEGPVIATTVPLSFWGGLNPTTGEIIDRHHPLSKQTIAHQVFVLPSGRGSCTGSGILLEAIYSSHAPAAILMQHTDEILSLGSIVADEWLQKPIPIIVLSPTHFEIALKATYAFIHKNGQVELIFSEG
jgi:predicted aconitase with swiveling domain